jgi:hypothetical protein
LKTTELFAEQVLIGLLVLLMVGLIFLHPLHEFYRAHVGSKDYLEQLVTGGFILGTAYLIGMVYDRVVDTLLQDLESHCRLQFAIGNTDLSETDAAGPDRDRFEEGKYRIVVLESSEATEYMEYLRSRVRLTRALAIALPGITLSLLLALDHGRASRWWTAVAASLPVVYALLLASKLAERELLFERPPKTYHFSDVQCYMEKIRSLSQKQQFWLLLHDEVWIGLLLLTVSGSILILSTQSYSRFWILLVGLVLTMVVGWAWWRILKTFYAFLRNYYRHRPKPKGSA